MEITSRVQARKKHIIDQLFTMRQILEKGIEHNQKVFINFIDLKQAFDSIGLHVALSLIFNERDKNLLAKLYYYNTVCYGSVLCVYMYA